MRPIRNVINDKVLLDQGEWAIIARLTLTALMFVFFPSNLEILKTGYFQQMSKLIVMAFKLLTEY